MLSLQVLRGLPAATLPSASAVSHHEAGGAHMSQELPSFHDWGTAGSISPAHGSHSGEVVSHSASAQAPIALHSGYVAVVSTSAAATQEAGESSGQQGSVDLLEGFSSGLNEFGPLGAGQTEAANETMTQLPLSGNQPTHGSQQQQQQQQQQQRKPNVLAALQSGAAHQAAEALDVMGGHESSHPHEEDSVHQQGTPSTDANSCPCASWNPHRPTACLANCLQGLDNFTSHHV